MIITDVRLRIIDKDIKLKAVASVTFDNEFVVHDIKVVEGNEALFVAMPSKRIADGEFRDIAHPINAETRKKIQDRVLEEYQRVLEEGPQETQSEEE